MSHTSYKSHKIKSFIKAFDFPNPNWEDLPVGFPNLSQESLTKKEKCLLDAIKLAWLTETPTGKKKIAKTSVFACISLICLISLIQLTLTGSQSQLTKPVSAAAVERGYATVSAALKTGIEDIYKSTMSAIFK